LSRTEQIVTKVNFGCFNANVEGWVGVDNALRHIILARVPLLAVLAWKFGYLNNEQYKWHKKGCFQGVRYGDVKKRLTFKDSSVNYIYTSHMLEHLFQDEAIFFLGECFRVLKSGGKLRICLPGWDDCRMQASFTSSRFARNKKEMKYSHKWLWSRAEVYEVL